ncbi:TIGR02594 family protein [Bradyrhizobium sp. LeoA1S1]
MVQLRAFRRLLRVLALALCSTVIVASISPASARPHHGAGRHARAYHAGHHAKHHHARAHHWRRVRVSRFERGVAQMQAQGLADSNASLSPEPQQAASFGSSNIVDEARRHLGVNPTSRGSLWCARFMNMVLQHSGYRGTGSDMASSFARYGQRVSGPQVGAIAVMSRGRRGGHVGIITGIDAKGNPIMISGNNGNRVREAPVSRGRIYAYVMPTISRYTLHRHPGLDASHRPGMTASVIAVHVH